MPRKERSDKESRKNNSIVYPRKCHHCDYISNNPQMWHYHNRTHDPIPEGRLCDHGCGLPARFFNTKGTYTCQRVAQHCSAYLDRHSLLVSKQWADPNSKSRKEETKLSLIQRLHTTDTVEKQKATKRKKSGMLTPELAKNFRHYARRIRYRAQQWAMDQGIVLGQQTFHVDHKLSILDAWNAGLSLEVVGHPVNLQVIEAKLNMSKGSKSILTIEELLRLITEQASQASV